MVKRISRGWAALAAWLVDRWLLPKRSAGSRVLVGVAFGLIAAGMRVVLTPLLADRIPWVMAFPAVLLAALLGDTLAALTALVLYGAFMHALFPAPTYWALVTFAFAGGIIAVAGVALRRTMVLLRRSTQEANDAYARAEQARQRTEDALAIVREADRRKDEFLAMLAHELRNPLAPIRYAVGILDGLQPSDPRIQRVRDLIERQVSHLSQLVDDLIDVSRITRGKITLKREPLRLAEILEETVDAVRPSAEQHRQALSLHSSPEPIALDADRARLTQVFGNLLLNAVKFTPDGGHIAVESSFSEGQAQISVRDTGVGIAPELQRQVFDLFFQEDGNPARVKGGLGIGLTLVKRLVELHGGSVSVQSAGRGQGATFTVRLPARLEPGTATAPLSLVGKPARGLKVLVVEDNVDAADSLQMLLSLDGHEVRVAYDGRQALQLLVAFHPAVALIDIGLPELTGLELAQRIRSDRRGRTMTLVALTGYGQHEDRVRSITAGFNHHLTKPVAHETLLEVLGEVSRRSNRSNDSATA